MSDDYVKCVLLGIEGSQETWCGRKNVIEWAFADASHAALNGRAEGRLMTCDKCAVAIAEALGVISWML